MLKDENKNKAGDKTLEIKFPETEIKQKQETKSIITDQELLNDLYSKEKDEKPWQR